MAERLRCVTIKATIASGQTADDNVASFINQTGDTISIRKVHLALGGNGMNAGDSALLELSRDPTNSSNVNGDQTRRIVISMRAPEQTTASTTAGGHVTQVVVSFAKDQFPLEAGQDLHLNASSTSTTSMSARCQVWWHINN